MTLAKGERERDTSNGNTSDSIRASIAENVLSCVLACVFTYDPFSWPGRSARVPRLNGWIYADIGNPPPSLFSCDIHCYVRLLLKSDHTSGTPGFLALVAFLNTRQMARKSAPIGKGKKYHPLFFSFSLERTRRCAPHCSAVCCWETLRHYIRTICREAHTYRIAEINDP